MDVGRASAYHVKPMNCPIPHPDLQVGDAARTATCPIRYAELGTVYRYERSGVLHGMMRVRGFTQDDAHIFCTPDQIADEFDRLLDLVDYMMEHVRLRVPRRSSRRGRRRRSATRRSATRRRTQLRAGARAARPGRTRSTRAAARSTARRSTSCWSTRSAGSGRARRSSSTSTCRSASSSTTSAPDNRAHRPVMIHRDAAGLDGALRRRADRALRRRVPGLARARAGARPADHRRGQRRREASSRR